LKEQAKKVRKQDLGAFKAVAIKMVQPGHTRGNVEKCAKTPYQDFNYPIGCLTEFSIQ